MRSSAFLVLLDNSGAGELVGVELAGGLKVEGGWVVMSRFSVG